MVALPPWSPSSGAALARLVARARAAAGGTGWPEGELLAQLLPRRGDAVRVEAACAVLDGLAVAHAAQAARLGAALAGCAARWRLAAGRARQDWLASLAAGQEPAPRLLAAEQMPQARAHGAGWCLSGTAHCFGAAAGPLLVFAEAGAGRVRRLLPLVALLPAAGASAPAAARPAWQSLPLDGVVAQAIAGAGEGDAQAALSLGLAVQRVAGAALLLGVAAEAFALAQAAADGAAAHALAGGAAGLSAARLLLREAARAAQADAGDAALPLLALRAAEECAERLVGLAVPLAGGDPEAADPARLQALLVARRLHQGFAAPSSTPRAAPAPAAAARLPEEASPTMARPVPPSASAAAPARTEPAGDRVSAILDAAADAFTQQSYDATSLDAIGDAIGVTKGSIYHHYRSKAELFVAVYRRTMEMNIATVEPIARQRGVRPVERLYRMAHAHALQVMKHLSYQRLAVQGTESHLMNRVNEEQRAQLAEVVRLRDRYEELFLATIRAAIEAGELPRQDARLAVKPVFGAINWTTMWYQPRPGETAADRARIADQLAAFVVSGLGRAYQPVPAEGEAEVDAAR